MRHDLTYTENLLETTFSAAVAESEAAQRAYLHAVATREDSRERDSLRAELTSALSDPGFDWDALFDQLDIAIRPGDPARPFMVEQIWVPLFGREALPTNGA